MWLKIVEFCLFWVGLKVLPKLAPVFRVVKVVMLCLSNDPDDQFTLHQEPILSSLAKLFMKVHCGVHLSIRELTAFLRTRLSFSSVFSLKLRIGKVSKLLCLQTVNR